MKFGAFQQLARHPAAIALSSSQEVLVLLASGGQSELQGYNQDLSPIWNRALRTPASAIVVTEGKSWVLDESSALAFTGQGECVAQVAFKPREELRAASFRSEERRVGKECS